MNNNLCHFLTLVSLLIFTISSIPLLAQHEGHDMPVESQDVVDTMPPMSHAFSLSLPMSRNGSGTGWLPDASPMYGYMVHSDQWMYMFHGNIFLRYNDQDVTNKGDRGDNIFDAPNWLMAMGQRRVGRRGLFRFSAMFSLDDVITGGSGYPLLFQSGETFEGQRLVDRQHPHDLISELSIGYTHMVNQHIDVFGYLAYPGEPALGPVAFMHRPSALNNPDAGLGHHWQDATHIIFGVATAGLRYKQFKVEGSLFTGREPDENRYNLDKPRFDSYSARVSYNPTENYALQISRAYIRSPEMLEPDEDVIRTTASVIQAKHLGKENFYLTSALVWGFNDKGDDHQEHSVSLEGNLQLDKTAIYSRYEWVQKSPEELALTDFDDHELFNVNAITLGVNQTIFRSFQTSFSLGVQGSLFMADDRLDPFYGNNPLSFEVYLRISPHLMRMGSARHGGSHH